MPLLIKGLFFRSLCTSSFYNLLDYTSFPGGLLSLRFFLGFIIVDVEGFVILAKSQGFKSLQWQAKLLILPVLRDLWLLPFLLLPLLRYLSLFSNPPFLLRTACTISSCPNVRALTKSDLSGRVLRSNLATASSRTFTASTCRSLMAVTRALLPNSFSCSISAPESIRSSKIVALPLMAAKVKAVYPLHMVLFRSGLAHSLISYASIARIFRTPWTLDVRISLSRICSTYPWWYVGVNWVWYHFQNTGRVETGDRCADLSQSQRCRWELRIQSCQTPNWHHGCCSVVFALCICQAVST